MNEARKSEHISAEPVPANEALLRVAAVQLPRLSAEDREPDEAEPVAALLPYVKREMGR